MIRSSAVSDGQPVAARTVGPARSGRLPARRRSAARSRTEVGRGAERLGRPGQVEQMQAGDDQEDDPSHDLVNATGWPITSSMVAMVRSARPARTRSARSPRWWAACAGPRAVLLPTARGRVPMRDRVGRGRLGDERDLIAQVERDPGGGLRALLGPDAADDQLGDAALGEQLLQTGRRERVMRGLGENGLPDPRSERLEEADVAAGGVEVPPGPVRCAKSTRPGRRPPTPSTRRATSSATRGLEMACHSGRWRNDSWTSMTTRARVMPSSIPARHPSLKAASGPAPDRSGHTSGAARLIFLDAN